MSHEKEGCRCCEACKKWSQEFVSSLVRSRSLNHRPLVQLESYRPSTRQSRVRGLAVFVVESRKSITVLLLLLNRDVGNDREETGNRTLRRHRATH